MQTYGENTLGPGDMLTLVPGDMSKLVAGDKQSLFSDKNDLPPGTRSFMVSDLVDILASAEFRSDKTTITSNMVIPVNCGLGVQRVQKPASGDSGCLIGKVSFLNEL